MVDIQAVIHVHKAAAGHKHHGRLGTEAVEAAETVEAAGTPEVGIQADRHMTEGHRVVHRREAGLDPVGEGQGARCIGAGLGEVGRSLHPHLHRLRTGFLSPGEDRRDGRCLARLWCRRRSRWRRASVWRTKGR